MNWEQGESRWEQLMGSAKENGETQTPYRQLLVAAGVARRHTTSDESFFMSELRF